jgi:hypothetical protein
MVMIAGMPQPLTGAAGRFNRGFEARGSARFQSARCSIMRDRHSNRVPG